MAFLAESGDRKYFFMDRYVGSHGNLKAWIYIGHDALATVTTPGYFDDWDGPPPASGDILVVYHTTDRNDLTASLSVEYLIVIEWNVSYKRLEGNIANIEPSGGDDTANIQYGLDNYKYTRLREGELYTISSALTITQSNRHLIGNDATIYLPAADFDNTTLTGSAPQTNGVALYIHGLTSSPFTAIENVSVRGVTFESEVSDGRCVHGVVARNVEKLKIVDNEFFGFPVGVDISTDTCPRAKVHDNNCHDRTDDTDWSPGNPQMSAIVIDNNRVNALFSHRISIRGNTIDDIIPGATFIAAHGSQTDGITIANTTMHGEIIGNKISNVGEGVDCFGQYFTISGNTVTDCSYYGIALKHTNAFNTVSGNTVKGCEIACVAIGAGGADDADGNVVIGNTLTDITGSGDRACVKFLVDTGATSPTNTIVMGNVMRPGATGSWAVFNDSAGTGNRIERNEMSAGGSGLISDVPETLLISRPITSGWEQRALDPGNPLILLSLNNHSGDANTGVILDLNPSTEEANTRSVQLLATTAGSNVPSMRFMGSGSSGAVPSERGRYRNGWMFGELDPSSQDKGQGTINVENEIWMNGIVIIAGTGAPEGVVTAPVGSLYLNKSGGSSTTLYAKESGAGNTGWIAR